MVIDAHTHFLPPEVKLRLDKICEDEPYWGLLLSPPTGRSIQAYASAERMLADMDAAGVDCAVVVGEYYQNSEGCRYSNDQSVALKTFAPDRIFPLVTVQPLDLATALDELKRGRDNGFTGVGELNPYAQGFSIESPEFEAVVEFCVDHDWPINLHINEEIGPFYNGKTPNTLRHFFDLAVRFPEAKFVLAHWGGGLLFYELMDAVRRQLANVWYDTAASPLQYSTAKIFDVALACCGPEKLIYGSDYPLRLFPKTQRKADMRPFLSEINNLNLAFEVQQLVLGENAARCFNLNQADRTSKIPGKIREPSQLTSIVLNTPLALIRHEPGLVEILARFGIRLSDPVFSWEPLVQAAAAAGLPRSRWPALIDALNEYLSTHRGNIDEIL